MFPALLRSYLTDEGWMAAIPKPMAKTLICYVLSLIFGAWPPHGSYCGIPYYFAKLNPSKHTLLKQIQGSCSLGGETHFLIICYSLWFLSGFVFLEQTLPLRVFLLDTECKIEVNRINAIWIVAHWTGWLWRRQHSFSNTEDQQVSEVKACLTNTDLYSWALQAVTAVLLFAVTRDSLFTAVISPALLWS